MSNMSCAPPTMSRIAAALSAYFQTCIHVCQNGNDTDYMEIQVLMPIIIRTINNNHLDYVELSVVETMLQELIEAFNNCPNYCNNVIRYSEFTHFCDVISGTVFDLICAATSDPHEPP